MQLALVVAASLLLALGSGVYADQTITVDAQDLTIHYTSTNSTDTGATWTVVQRNTDSCDTPQELSSRLGDTMTYTFTGTGVQVIGTTGVKRGLLNFTLDGESTTFDRTSTQLQCDQVLFQKFGLPLQQHTVTAVLIGRALDFSTGEQDGVLSVQRIRYTIPGGSDGTNVGPIVGGIVGGVVFIGLVGALWFFYRRRQTRRLQRRSGRGYFDDEDIVTNNPTGGGGGIAHKSDHLVATPFEWNGPNSNPRTTDAAAADDNLPGSDSQPLLLGFSSPTRSAYSNIVGPNALPPPTTQGPRTHTSSSRSDPRRDSNLTGTNTLVASNPDSSSHGGRHYPPEKQPGGPRRQSDAGVGGAGAGPSGSGVQDDSLLVDRIALRLADMLTERVGHGGAGAGDMELGALPPYIDPEDARLGIVGTAGPSQAQLQPTSPPPPTSASPTTPPHNQLSAPQSQSQSSAAAAAYAASRFGPRPRPSNPNRQSSISLMSSGTTPGSPPPPSKPT